MRLFKGNVINFLMRVNISQDVRRVNIAKAKQTMTIPVGFMLRVRPAERPKRSQVRGRPYFFPGSRIVAKTIAMVAIDDEANEEST